MGTRRLLKQNVKRSVFLEEGPHGARVIKRFHAPGAAGKWRDGARARAELRSLAAAADAGLAVPRPIGVARVDGAYELAMEAVAGARDLREVLAVDGASAALADALGALLARAHACGLRHRDAHAGNVVVGAGGRAWLVDLAGARFGAPPSRRAMQRDLVRLGADLREATPPRFRARALAAWHRALPEALRRAVPSPSEWIESLEAAARARRRADVARRVSVWHRESSSAKVVGRIVRRRGYAPDASDVVVEGEDAAATWDVAARLAMHGVPALLPGELTRGAAPSARLSIDATAAAGFGAILGALLDRGLMPADARGRARVPSYAELVRAGEGWLLAPGPRLAHGEPRELAPLVARALSERREDGVESAPEAILDAMRREWRGTRGEWRACFAQVPEGKARDAG